MERTRHRKTKSASGIEGIHPIQKQKTVPRLSSDSHSYIDGSNTDGMFMLGMGQSTLGRSTGVPMKKFLAEEMSKDVEYKRRSPGVVARLMGFEGLPSPRLANTKQKNFPENYQQKNVSFNDQINSQLYDGLLNWRSSNQQEFKDVYEDFDASHVVNRRCSSRWSSNSILTKPEMELIQKKFMDAKRPSTNEKLQVSKELDDTLEMLDSDKDLLLKIYHQPDSVLMKNLHDLQVDPDNSFVSHAAALKPSDSEKFDSKSKARRWERGFSNKCNVTSQLKREDGLLLERHNCHRAYISRNSSEIQEEEVAGETRIVVLKPNLGKMRSHVTSFSSPDHSQGYLPYFKKINEYPSVGCAETRSCRRNYSSHNTGLLKARSKKAREIARDIMRESCDVTMDGIFSTYRGYVGDESSCDENESDSDSEIEVLKSSSGRSLDDGKNCIYPSSHCDESPVNMEAKKRLSERWKMTRKYQDLEIICGGRTLGEMLASSDKETRPQTMNAKMSPSTNQASEGVGSSNNGTATLDLPLGISSKDGWKDEICRNSTRSKSLPPATGGSGRSHRRSTNHDRWDEDKNLMHSDSVHRGRSKVKGNLSHREKYSAKDSRSRRKTDHTSQHIFSNKANSSSETKFKIHMEPNTKDSSEHQSMFTMAETANSSEFPVVDVMMTSEPGSTTLSSKSYEMLPEVSLSTIASDKDANHKQEGSHVQELLEESPKRGSLHVQCLGTERESSESSKEADHHSPISVLEVPCCDDTSSSESFERVSAELHGLRMQLKLLKMESDAYSETSALHPIEEEEAQLSPNVSEGNYTVADDSWRIFYALDVLIESGFEDSPFNMLRMLSNWPLDPKTFDKLEKKYNDEGLRWERWSLFDRTNSALLELFGEHENLYPQVMPISAGWRLQWQSLEDAVKRLIEQDRGKEISRSVLEREIMFWDSNGQIDILGNEIEKVLIDDLITEVICN